MQVSVAMCTYNGEEYLLEQLTSIAHQTRCPDELIISDDCSTDDTLKIVERFIASANFPVLLNRNRTQIGSTANFQKAIELCSGDIIVLCDQDDVWLDDRLCVTESVFQFDPTTAMFFSNARLLGDSGIQLRGTLWHNLRFKTSNQIDFRSGAGFDLLLRRNLVTGATMAFQSDLRSLLLPIPTSWVHDAWIALLSCFYGKVAMDDRPLILYRQHDRQQLGAEKASLLGGLLKARSRTASFYEGEVARFECLWRRLNGVAGDSVRQKNIDHLERKIEFCRHRLAYSGGGYWAALRIIFDFCKLRYWKYANGWRGAATDIAVVLKGGCRRARYS